MNKKWKKGKITLFPLNLAILEYNYRHFSYNLLDTKIHVFAIQAGLSWLPIHLLNVFYQGNMLTNVPIQQDNLQCAFIT